MINDKQGREWLLQKFYDEGYRYYVMDSSGLVYLTAEIPPKEYITNELKVSSCKKAISVMRIKSLLPKLNSNECISIAEELGIVNWRNVKVNTPVLVSSNGIKWYKRYFAKADYLDVCVWNNGATSWSAENANDTNSWNHIKLAEV